MIKTKTELKTDKICQRTINENIIRIRNDEELTLPLSILNEHYEFKKEWERCFNITHKKEINDEVGIKRNEYYEKNKDKIKDMNKKYREENKDKIKVRNKKYCEENKDKINEYYKKYREENKDKIKVREKKYYEENKEKIKVKKKLKQEKENDINLGKIN